MIKQAIAGALVVLATACGITQDPVVVQGFNQVVGCVIQNDSSFAAILANCARYATAELIAAIEYALSDSAFTAAHPDDAAKLTAVLPSLKAKLAAEQAADASGKNSLP
jgi:hypothetical protein